MGKNETDFGRTKLKADFGATQSGNGYSWVTFKISYDPATTGGTPTAQEVERRWNAHPELVELAEAVKMRGHASGCATNTGAAFGVKCDCLVAMAAAALKATK